MQKLDVVQPLDKSDFTLSVPLIAMNSETNDHIWGERA